MNLVDIFEIIIIAWVFYVLTARLVKSIKSKHTSAIKINLCLIAIALLILVGIYLTGFLF